jgi:hypothetical protein
MAYNIESLERNMFKEIHDAITGITTRIEMTAEEIAEMQAERTRLEEKAAIRLAEKEARDVERQVILDRLGLTAEEAALLLGGN